MPLAARGVHDRRRVDRRRSRHRRRVRAARRRSSPRARWSSARSRTASPSSPRTRSCSRTTARSCSTPSDAAGVDLAFEAAVAGGIPLIAPLRESLAGDRITRILGIVNGTTNYILTQMSEHGSAFDDALAEAQRLGYAEADPTADVEGFDAAAKCAILASIAFDTRVVASDVYREGITEIQAQDIADARDSGYMVKLLAIAELDDDEVSVRVHPAMVPDVAPARDRPRRVQRGVRRGGQGGPADVLRPRRGRRSDGGRGRRRPGAGGAATASAGTRGIGCTCVVRAADPPDGRHARPVLPEPARRGRARRARRDRRRSSDATACRSSASGRRGSARRPRSCSSRTARRRARSRRRCSSCASSRSCGRSRACCAWRAEEG